MIENTDRGITLNKTLAWAIVSGLVVAGIWVGANVQGSQTQMRALGEKMEKLSEDLSSAASSRLALETRVRSLENGAARQDANFENISRSIEELKAEQRENNRLLREFLNQRPPIGGQP